MYKIGIGSTNNPLSNIFAYSYHMSGWYCIDDDIVRRNFILFTHVSRYGGSEGPIQRKIQLIREE